MYFTGDIVRERLYQSCQELVARNEILRTVFVDVEEMCYGVVLDALSVPADEYEIEDGLEAFVKSLCNVDVQSRLPLGSAFVKFFFVQGPGDTSALVFRLSHAQYDEICLPLCLRQLSALYEGKPVQATLPFSSFVYHVVRQNIPQSVAYWRQLLEGSSMTRFRPDSPVTSTAHYAIQESFDISSRSKDITVATLPTAAWALCLARHLGVRDVVFGEVVSGRNIDFPNCESVMGPCWQYVPVRVTFDPSWTAADLLAFVQHQHAASSAFEGIGLRELVRECTDWPDTVDWFETVVHQDVDHVERLDFFETSCRMETIYPHAEPLREWKIQAFVSGDTMTIEIVTVESWQEHAREILGEVGEALRLLLRQSLVPLLDDSPGTTATPRCEEDQAMNVAVKGDGAERPCVMS
jgi:hypothetical protein